MQKLWLALLSALLGIAPAQAQNFTMPPPAGVTVGGFVVVPTCAAQTLAATQGFGTMDETGALCVNATVMATATIAGFPTVQSTGTPISVSTVSATGTLPSGTVVVASNVGATNGAYCKLGASATTSDQLIPPNSWFAFTVGANTQLSCITSTSTTTVNMVGGSGIATGSGGGGGGGGSGGSVTQGTSPWVVGQATGTNLHVVTDTTSTTAVTQGTASNLNATVVGTGTFVTQSTVTQATGTNLHAVIDTGSTTAATQATASNLNAQVVGAGASGSAMVGNPVRVALSDNTNTQNWFTALVGLLGDGVNGQNMGAVGSWLFNGASWDRAPGTTKGAYGIIRDAAGNARGANVNASSQLSVSCDNGCSASSSITGWGGGTLGAMANYGTSPGAVLVPGVNAFVTNTNANGQATMTNSSPVVIASNQTSIPVASTLQAGTAHAGTVGVAPYADGAVPITATATGTTAATTATLAASAGGLKTYICGFSIRANATAAVTNNATLTGVITATMNFTQWTAPLASGLGVTEMVFSPCIPSSATNTAINVVSGAPGTGGTVSVSAWGYQL